MIEREERPETHGLRLPPDEHRLLRGRPPQAALTWAAAAIGPGAQVRSARALSGGTSSAVHALTVVDTAGREQRAILRRFVRAGWLAEEPDLATREAWALRFLEAAPLPTPRLLAVDPDGSLAGSPAVLMTRLPGRIEWSPGDLSRFVVRLAQPLPAIHGLPVPDASPLPEYAPYAIEMHRPPRWATKPEVWLRAFEVHAGPIPSGERAFIHRDYHPGNLLWTRGRLTGIVDWVNASLGPPDADVGHCRLNLAWHFDQPTADAFLAEYQSLTGRRDYHPYWDIVAAVGGLDESTDGRPNLPVERFLAAAVARL